MERLGETRQCRCASSTSPPATAATCSRRSNGSAIKPESILLRDYSDINVEAGRALIGEKGLDGDRAVRQGRRVRSRQPGRRRAEADARHRLRPLRAVPRQRHGAALARGTRRGDSGRRLSRLHRPALASAARADRPRADQPPPGPGLDHAPAHPGRDGPARRGGRLPQDRAAHRRVGHLHRVARGADRAREPDRARSASAVARAASAGGAPSAGSPSWRRSSI